MVIATGGYDLPSFEKLTTFKTWAEEGPPKGTLYHYPESAQSPDPLGRRRRPRRTRSPSRSTTRASQTQMAVRYFKGEAMDKTLDWAAKEIEGFMRN